jgi:hypothetical protein
MASASERYDMYREAAEREIYLFRSGQKSRLELEAVDDRFADVTGGEGLPEIERSERAAVAEEARAGWRRLGLAVVAAVTERRMRGILRELKERESSQRLAIDGEERTAFAWQAALGSEKDAARRGRIQDGLEKCWAELNPLREEVLARRAELLARYGHATLLDWASALHPGVDYEAWGAHASLILERTEGLYRAAMAQALAAVGVDPARARPSDAARVFRWERLDSILPAARAEEALDFTTEGMGIRLGALDGVTVDREIRPGKHPRAGVVAPRIPGEIYVLVYPRGGAVDYESLFHEAGHAFHLAFTSPELPVERRRLFDPALGEAWAFLVHYRLADRAWAAETPAGDRLEEWLSAARLHKLFLVRRYAAKLRFELRLCREARAGPLGSLGDLYAEELARATGLRYREAGYLVDTDPDLYSADYLRAWCLEARMAEHLRERFGRRFWRERRAGDLLKELWNTGGTYTADGLAEDLGIGPVGPDALIEDSLRGA